MSASEVIIKSTHRGLRYEDGVLTGILDPGRHELPVKRAFRRTPRSRSSRSTCASVS